MILSLVLSSLTSFSLLNAEVVELPKEFTTEFMVMTVDGEKRETGKAFSASPELVRTELEVDGKKQINIYRDKKRYVLIPERKEYQIFVNGYPLIDEFAVIYQVDARWNKVKEKEINGKDAVKWDVTYRVNNQDKTVKVWTDANNNNPLRIRVDDKIVNFVNFKVGAPDPSLFEVPEGYTEIKE